MVAELRARSMKGRYAPPASATVVQALRDEINASFDAHKCVVQSIAKEFSSLRQQATLRQSASSHRSLASPLAQWRAFDLLMESISPVPSHGSLPQPLQQSGSQKISVLLNQRLQERNAMDRPVDLHQMLLLWRQAARVKGEHKRIIALLQTRYYRAAVYRVLTHWRVYSSLRGRLNDAAMQVRQASSTALLSSVYMRWRTSLSVQRSVFGLQGRRAFERQRQAFCFWLGAICKQQRVRRFSARCRDGSKRRSFALWHVNALSQHGKRTRSACVRSFRLRSFWRRWSQYHQQCVRARDLLSAISQQRDCLAAEESFDRWCDYVETRKRSRFARAWCNQHTLAEVVDAWRSAQLRTRRDRCIVESASRRRQRRWLVLCMDSWRHAVQRSRYRKHRLMCCLSRRDLSRGFNGLQRYWRWVSTLERNRLLRRAHSLIWNWYLHSQRRKRIRIAAERVARQSSVRAMRAIAWNPWRDALVQSIKHRCILQRYRKKATMKAWLAWVHGLAECAHQQAQLRSVERTWKTRQRQMAVKRWSKFSSSMNEQRMHRQDSYMFRSHRLARIGIQRWTAWMQYRNSRRVQMELSVQHSLRCLLRRWIFNVAARKNTRMRIGFQMETRRRVQSLTESLADWRMAVGNTRRERSRWVFRRWRRFVFEQHRECTLRRLSRSIWRRRVWRIWRSSVAYELRIRANVQSVVLYNERRMKKLVLVDIWYTQARCYQLARQILQNVDKCSLLIHSLACWKHQTQCIRRNRQACTWFETRSKRNCFKVLVAQTLGRKKSVRKWRNNYELLRAWRVWLLFLARRRSMHLADAHFRGFWMVRAVAKWHNLTSQTLNRCHKNQIASTWHSVMLQESAIAVWKSAVSRTKHHELLTERIQWSSIGKRSFRSWRSLLRRHEQLRAMDFVYQRKLLQRSWNALVQITKRRQVAQAMWKYTKGRIIVAKCLQAWDLYARLQQSCSIRAEAMCVQRQRRQMSSCFHQWSKFMAIQAFVGLRIRRIATQRVRECWRAWIICWKLAQLERTQRLKLLKHVFERGLRRYALQSQAYREVKSHCDSGLLSSSLSRWRVEWWLNHSQRIMQRSTKQTVLSQWRAFVEGRRQQRHELRSAMSANHSASRPAQPIGKARPHATQAYKQASALRKRVVYWRQVVSRMFHAWYLVMKTSQRRHRQLHLKRLFRRAAYQGSAGVDQENVMPNNWLPSDHDGVHLHRHISPKRTVDVDKPPPQQRSRGQSSGFALEFWSSQLLAKCFVAWKHQRRVKTGFSGT